MADCNDCGGCCDPVQLVFSQDQLRAAGPSAMTSARDYEWALNDLTRIPYREGLRRAPHLRQGGITTGYTPAGDIIIMHAVFYECRWYDKDEKRCTNYDNRPDVCSGYPWYDEPPDPAKAIPLDCSYREDLTSTPIPAPTRKRRSPRP